MRTNSYKYIILQGNQHKVSRSQITVVIDVIRAFTVSKLLFDKGVSKITLAENSVTALLMREQNNNKLLLAGEVGGLKIEGFDLDNSPYTINKADLSGCKSLVQMTTNGTKAALNAKDSDIVLVTGMTNAMATAKFIQNELSSVNETTSPDIVLVASHPESDEDVACAEYIVSLMQNPATDAAPYIKRIESAKVAEKFLDPDNRDFLIEDLMFSARVEDSDYVMQVTYTEHESFITKRTI